MAIWPGSEKRKGYINQESSVNIISWFCYMNSVWGLCCHILGFIMPDIFLKSSPDRSGLQDSQSNTQTILLQSHASLRLTDCILVLYFWKRTHRIWMAAYAVPKPFSQMCKLHATETNMPSYHYRGWLLNFVLVTIWIAIFLLGLKDKTSMISTNYLKCWSAFVDEIRNHKCGWQWFS